MLPVVLLGLAAGIGIGLLIGAAIWKKAVSRPRGLRFIGGRFMRVFPQTRPADVVHFKPAVVVDAEGAPVDPQPSLSYSFSSSDESICSIKQLNVSDPLELTITYNTAKKLDDGSFGIASLRAEASLTLEDQSVIKDVVTEDIQLHPGAAAGFTPGGFGIPEN